MCCVVVLLLVSLIMCFSYFFFFFKQKTAYEMRISDWSSDVCSSDLPEGARVAVQVEKSPEALLLYLATLRAGLVYLPLNTAYRESEVAYFLGDAEPSVVVCKVRAKQEQEKYGDRSEVMALLMHGDAAFAGQGLVPETLDLSELKGYRIGGTIHFIVTNQT